MFHLKAASRLVDFFFRSYSKLLTQRTFGAKNGATTKSTGLPQGYNNTQKVAIKTRYCRKNVVS